MGGSLGGLVCDSRQDKFRVFSWRSWIVALSFYMLWFGVIFASMILISLFLLLIGVSAEIGIHLSISFSYLIVIPLTILFMGIDKQLSNFSRKLKIKSAKEALILLLAIPILVTIVDCIVVIAYGIGYEAVFGVPEVNTDIGVDWDSGQMALGLAITSIVIIGPLAEELMFRGYLLDAIRKMHGDRVAVIITAFLFGLIHLEPYTIGMAAIGGLIYGYVRIRTGSLWPSIIGHMLWNGVALVVTYL